MKYRTFKTSKTFPAEVGERFNVCDGKGRTLETWRCTRIQEGKEHNWITYFITYR